MWIKFATIGLRNVVTIQIDNILLVELPGGEHRYCVQQVDDNCEWHVTKEVFRSIEKLIEDTDGIITCGREWEEEEEEGENDNVIPEITE